MKVKALHTFFALFSIFALLFMPFKALGVSDQRYNIEQAFNYDPTDCATSKTSFPNSGGDGAGNQPPEAQDPGASVAPLQNGGLFFLGDSSFGKDLLDGGVVGNLVNDGGDKLNKTVLSDTRLKFDDSNLDPLDDNTKRLVGESKNIVLAFSGVQSNDIDATIKNLIASIKAVNNSANIYWVTPPYTYTSSHLTGGSPAFLEKVRSNAAANGYSVVDLASFVWGPDGPNGQNDPKGIMSNSGQTFSDTGKDTAAKYVSDTLLGKGTGGPAPKGQTYWLGDSLSVGLGLSGGLTAKLDAQGFKPNKLNADPGRSIRSGGVTLHQSGLQAVDADRAFIKDAKLIVIFLGTNVENDFAGAQKELLNKLHALAPNAQYVWIDNAASGSPSSPDGPAYFNEGRAKAAAENEAIYSNTGAFDAHYQVISQYNFVWGNSTQPKDLGSRVPPDPNKLLGPDGVHYGGSGYQKLADYLVNGLANGNYAGGSESGTPGSGSSACNPCTVGGLSGNGTLPDSVPKPYHDIFIAAGSKNNVEPALVAAIFYAGEHGSSWPNPPPPYGTGPNWASSYAGAQGPFQFLPSTWKTQGQDGNGDGKVDIMDLTDGAFGAANYLGNSGAHKGADEAGVKKAIFAYNHDQGYVNTVYAAYLKFLGAGGTGITSGATTGGCPGPGAASKATDIGNVSRADLVNRIKNSQEFVVSTKHGYPVTQDIDTIWAPATSGRPSGTQDAVLKALVTILEQYAHLSTQKIPIELFNRTQSPCGDFDKGAQNYGPYTSSHAYGLALDIDTTTMQPDAATNLFKWIYDNREVLQVGELEHKPVPDGTHNIKYGGDYDYPELIQNDHADHIHVGIKGTGAKAPECQAKPGGERV